MSATTNTTKRNKKRGTVIRLSLAGLALVGIGAAATTAAWTDNVFFAAQASSATFDLKGSVNGGTYVDAPDSAASIAIDPATFANLIPGAVRTVTINVKNTGSVAALLNPATVTSANGVFTGSNAATVAITPIAAGTSLAPGAVQTLTLTVSAPANWDNSYQNKTGGTIVVKVDGASS